MQMYCWRNLLHDSHQLFLDTISYDILQKLWLDLRTCGLSWCKWSHFRVKTQSRSLIQAGEWASNQQDGGFGSAQIRFRYLVRTLCIFVHGFPTGSAVGSRVARGTSSRKAIGRQFEAARAKPSGEVCPKTQGFRWKWPGSGRSFQTVSTPSSKSW